MGEKPVSRLMIELWNWNKVVNVERVAGNRASGAVGGDPMCDEGTVEEVGLVTDAGNGVEERIGGGVTDEFGWDGCWRARSGLGRGVNWGERWRGWCRVRGKNSRNGRCGNVCGDLVGG